MPTGTLKIGLLRNNVIIENPEDKIENWIMEGDETEKVLILAAVENKLDLEKIKNEYHRLNEIPFDSERMWMATLHEIRMDALKLPEFVSCQT